MVILRKAIIISLLCLCSAALLFGIWVDISYASNLPAALNEKAARIYRMEVSHGSVRYGTDQELRTLRWAENVQMYGATFLLMAIVLRIRYARDFDETTEPVKSDMGRGLASPIYCDAGTIRPHEAHMHTLSPYVGVAIAVITIIFTDMLPDVVQSTVARPLIAAAIASLLTGCVVVVKRIGNWRKRP